MTDFVSRLRDFHLECGAPTYRSVVNTSKRLAELYPDRLQGRSPVALSLTAISEILNGKRTNPPTAEWVVSFVLSCQRRAFEACVLETDPGLETLPQWLEHHRQALRAARGALERSSSNPSAADGSGSVSPQDPHLPG